MRILLLHIFLFCTFIVVAQDDPDLKEPSKESWQYHEQRLKITTPPYGLAKVKQLVNTISETEGLVAISITDAEKKKDALVFEPGLEELRWKNDPTACWRFPNGISRGGIDDKMDHPVTCISYTDIIAYCQWAKVRLPTLDE